MGNWPKAEKHIPDDELWGLKASTPIKDETKAPKVYRELTGIVKTDVILKKVTSFDLAEFHVEVGKEIIGTVAWNKTAELCKKILTIGSKVLMSGYYTDSIRYGRKFVTNRIKKLAGPKTANEEIIKEWGSERKYREISDSRKKTLDDKGLCVVLCKLSTGAMVESLLRKENCLRINGTITRRCDFICDMLGGDTVTKYLMGELHNEALSFEFGSQKKRELTWLALENLAREKALEQGLVIAPV